MSTKLVRHRKSAYLAQSGLCYYCKRPMWQSDVESFSKTHNINCLMRNGLNAQQSILKHVKMVDLRMHRILSPLVVSAIKQGIAERIPDIAVGYSSGAGGFGCRRGHYYSFGW